MTGEDAELVAEARETFSGPYTLTGSQIDRLHQMGRRLVTALSARSIELEAAREALKFYRDGWTFLAVGDEGDGVTDMGRLDGYEACPTNAMLKDGGSLARAFLSKDTPAENQGEHND